MEKVKATLGFRAKGRDIIEGTEEFQVREEERAYNGFFDAEKRIIGRKNNYSWNLKTE